MIRFFLENGKIGENIIYFVFLKALFFNKINYLVFEKKSSII